MVMPRLHFPLGISWFYGFFKDFRALERDFYEFIFKPEKTGELRGKKR